MVDSKFGWRVMTDNGGCYRSTLHAITCRALGVRHLRTRP